MEKSKRTGLKWVLVLGVIAVALWTGRDQVGGFFANASAPSDQAASDRSGGSGGQRQSRGTPVIVEAVGEDRDAVVVEAIGTARAQRHVMLFPAVEDEIIELPIVAGQAVEKGDVIIRLDSRNASLAVRVAETRVKDATSALERAERLRDNNVRSRANVDDAEVELERARLELQQAREALSDRTLRAPFAGIVGIPKVEIGDRVNTDTDIVTVDDRSRLLVEFEVAERFLSRLRVGQPLSARTSAFEGKVVEGEIVKIDSRVDPVSRTVLVRAGFDNPEDQLRPGMSFFVRLALSGQTYASVPELSLQWRDGVSYVWIIDDGKAKRVSVTARRRLNTKVLVEGDIEPGQLVVVEGVQRLRNGRDVEISMAEQQ